MCVFAAHPAHLAAWLSHSRTPRLLSAAHRDTQPRLPPLTRPLQPYEATVELNVLQDSVIELIERAVQTGTVVIITNAETGWVELSCQKFMPRVAPLLNKVKVISARSTYESRYPESPCDWKVR